MPRITRRNLIKGVGLGVAGSAVVGAWPGTAAAEEASGIQIARVYERFDDGYHTFRVPHLAIAPNGDLLLTSNAKRGGASDFAENDVVLKRSTDGGRTWGPIQVIATDPPNKIAHSMIVDYETGRVHLIVVWNAGHVTAEDLAAGRVSPEDAPRPFHSYSDDNGHNWSDWRERELTADLKRDGMRQYVNGPGTGIQLRHGAHAGRLLLTGWHVFLPPTADEPQIGGVHTVYSDDHGETWQLGGAIGVPNGPEIQAGETSMTERADGVIHFNTRNDHATTTDRRATTTSSDGGATFDGPFRAVPDLITPMVHCSVRDATRRTDDHERLVFAGPTHLTSREQLTLRSSLDDGATWRQGPMVWDGPVGYTDMVRLDRTTLIVAMENGPRGIGEGGQSYHTWNSVARVPIEILDRQPPPPFTTPDASGNGLHAVVGGHPATVAGKFGDAISLNGHYAEVPLADALLFGTAPFSVAVWFRTSTDNPQRIAEAYNYDRYPKWHLEVRGQGARIVLKTDTIENSVIVQAAGNYLDGAWHHLAATRDGAGTVRVYVDGVAAAQRTGITGDLSAGALVGVRFGARLDGINNPVVGALDEAYLFDRALTAEAVADLYSANRAPVDPVVHLPFDVVRSASSSVPR